MRHVELEACFNFRDLGGYETADGRSVRWRTLFRSDTLHRLTDDDVEAIAGLGLRTIIDLRSVTELDDHGPARTKGAEVAWHHVPMLDNVKLVPISEAALAEAMANPVVSGHGYLAIADQFRGSIARVFSLLAAPGAMPSVYHCTSGKDRTGIISALVLEILGVPDAVIIDDYVLTERSRIRSRPWIEANEPEFAALLAQIPQERRTVSPDTIADFLSAIRGSYGGAEQFLLGAGVSAAEIDSLRDQLLDP